MEYDDAVTRPQLWFLPTKMIEAIEKYMTTGIGVIDPAKEWAEVSPRTRLEFIDGMTAEMVRIMKGDDKKQLDYMMSVYGSLMRELWKASDGLLLAVTGSDDADELIKEFSGHLQTDRPFFMTIPDPVPESRQAADKLFG